MKEVRFIVLLSCLVAILIIGIKYGITARRVSSLESRVTTLETDMEVIEKNIVTITKAMDHNFRFVDERMGCFIGEIVRLEDKINE